MTALGAVLVAVLVLLGGVGSATAAGPTRPGVESATGHLAVPTAREEGRSARPAARSTSARGARHLRPGAVGQAPRGTETSAAPATHDASPRGPTLLAAAFLASPGARTTHPSYAVLGARPLDPHPAPHHAPVHGRAPPR